MNGGNSMFTRFGVTFRKGDIIFCEYEPEIGRASCRERV